MATDLIDYKCQELKENISTINDRVGNLEQDVKSHNNTVLQYKSKVEETEENLHAFTEQMNQQNILTTTLSENMEQNVNSFNEIKNSFYDKMKEMNNSIHDLNDSRNNSNKQIEILWNKVKSLYVKLNDTESSLRNLSEEQLHLSLSSKTIEDKHKNLELKVNIPCLFK